MAIVPLRNLGALGIITDVDPYDLPINAFSFGKNVRFENGRVERGSVFRTVGSTGSDPRHIYGYVDNNNGNHILVVATDGKVADWSPTEETDKSPSDWTSNPSVASVSIAASNNLIVVNRPDRVPWFRSRDDNGSFQKLPGGPGQWDETWRAGVVRSISGVLVALGVTKGASQYPNDVLWSDFVPYNGTPNWDITSTTGSAGENTLAEMSEPIVDGLALKNRMMIYAQSETWFMEYIGGNAMFRFDRQFDRGILSANCVVENGGIHYVFGPDDIWMHDGLQDKSLAQGRVRQFIFDGLRKSARSQFFVAHNIDQNEIVFCYVSDDEFVRFPSVEGGGCNRAAIYNYATDAWYFADLPYVTSWTRAIVSKQTSFDETATFYDTLGGSYAAQEGETKLTFVMGSATNTASGITHGIRTYAPAAGGTTSFPIDTVASSGAFLYREGLDLDELKAELRGYKLASSVYPQSRLDNDAKPLVFTFGSSDHPSDVPTWGNPQEYSRQFYKLDHNVAGRYLSYKIEQNDYRAFTLSGLDVDLTLLGSR